MLNKLFKQLTFIIFVATLFLFLTIYLNNSSKYDPINLSSLIKKSKSEEKTGYKVQIKVENGCGTKGVADLYTNFLRNNGYDVIDYGNANNFDYKKTKMIIHNREHNTFIYEIVNLLSIQTEQLEYYYNNNIIYDLTLIIGSDFLNLDSYNEVSLHYEPF